MDIKTDITIDAPIDVVFSAFSDLDLLVKSLSGLIKLELLSGPPKMAVGTKWKETRVFMGTEATEVMWVTALTPNKSYTVEAKSNGTKYRSEYAFEKMGSRTKVEMVFRAEPIELKAKIFYAIGLLFRGSLKKILHQDMADLKKECEKSI